MSGTRSGRILDQMKQRYAGIFDHAESVIAEIVAEAEQAIGSSRADASRLRFKIAELEKLARGGVAALFVDPAMHPSVRRARCCPCPQTTGGTGGEASASS